MYIQVHPRVMRRRPTLSATDVETAVVTTLRSRLRDTDPPQWMGVGFDRTGRLLQYVAVETGFDEWLVFHAMPATKKVLIELDIKGQIRK